VFGRSKSAQTLTPAAPEPEADVRRADEGKGRPTPKRKVAEAANKRPLVPTDRRGAARAARERAREERNRQYQAMQTGDERHMPAKDRGPVRRYVRDWVDSRWNLGEFFLPLAAVFLVLQFSLGRSVLATVVVLALYVYIIVAAVDTWLMWIRLKRRLVAKFGVEAIPRGLTMYAVLRSFQLRVSRLPKPQVKHGQRPD